MINPETLCDIDQIDNSIYEMRADKIRDFLSYEPQKLETVKGHTFFECPIMGGEVGRVLMTPDCQLFQTDIFVTNNKDLSAIVDQGIYHGFLRSFGDFRKWEFI